jgi:predicted nuclease of predicted toxin-antitoxin system
VRFKTDENVHPDLAERLRADGHDAVTVWDQTLRGCEDTRLADACRSESRVLITFDKGFGDIRTYPPEAYAGLIVLRFESQSRDHVLAAWGRVAPLLGREPLSGKLWIVGEDGVRIRPGDAGRNV